MLSSGFFTCLFGMGYIYNIHSLSFYIFVQVSAVRGLSNKCSFVSCEEEEEEEESQPSPLLLTQVANGLVQTTGWPSVVTCIGNWFGKGR